MLKKNFEAITNLKALKKNAVELCGQDFILGLNRQGFNVNDDRFWLAVNEKLGIAANAYQAKQRQEQEERERQEQAKIDREIMETRCLLDNKQPVKTITRDDWSITTYDLPNSEIFGKKFIAIASKESQQIEKTTDLCDSLEQAYSEAYSWADNYDRDEQRELEFQKYYQVLKPLYLAAIYLSGWDEFVGHDHKSPPSRDAEARRQFYLEHFYGVSSFRGFDFNILNRLEKEGMLKSSTTGKTLIINKAAVRQAVEAIQQMNIPGMMEAIKNRGIPLDCLDYQNRYERMWAANDLDSDEE
jgi:hypothetical protein